MQGDPASIVVKTPLPPAECTGPPAKVPSLFASAISTQAAQVRAWIEPGRNDGTGQEWCDRTQHRPHHTRLLFINCRQNPAPCSAPGRRPAACALLHPSAYFTPQRAAPSPPIPRPLCPTSPLNPPQLSWKAPGGVCIASQYIVYIQTGSTQTQQRVYDVSATITGLVPGAK